MAGTVRSIRSVYIAGPWAKRQLIVEYCREVAALGYKVLSNWPEEEDAPHYALGMLSESEAARIAAAYIPQLIAADLFIQISCDGNFAPGGGRFWELGFFYRSRKPIVLVGRPEILFHALPETIRFPLWRECLEWLSDGADPEALGFTPFPEEAPCATCRDT